MHNYPFHDYPIRYAQLLGYGMCYSHLLALKYIDQVVSCSNFVGDKLQSHGIDATPIPNTVDTKKYHPVKYSSTRRSIRKSLELPLDATIFLYVGHVTTFKGTADLIEGFKQVNFEDRCELHIVGDGDQYQECARQASSVKEITLHGYTQHVVDYLCAADFYVSASKYEGLPTAVLEALSSGLPVGLSDIPPHEEILSTSPYAGVTFDRTQPNKIARAFRELRSLPYDQATSAARKLAVSRYDAGRMSERYHDLYMELLREAKSNC